MLANMYHNKKQMGMGGRNMPKLMKKGGKSSFPDLNNDGKVSFADILKGRLKKKSQEYGGKVMEQGGGVPEASADITRNPLMRGLFDDVVSAAEGSPEFAQLMSTIKSFDERSAKQQRDPMFGPARSRAIARDRRAYEEAFPEVDRGRFDLDFDENPNDAKSVQSGFSNFTDLVKSGDEDAMEMLVKMNDMYKEKFPGPEKFPVFRMFGVERSRRSQAYGGKVKLMKKGGTVDYFAGGALAAGLGQVAQRSQNPLIQGIGKVASTVGGMTPGGRAVNMAANFLPSGNPMAALGQLMKGR